MKGVPWKDVATWGCHGCGECCRPYTVPLSMWEWTRITQAYGGSVTEIRADGLFLKKRQGRCVFQYRRSGKWLCSIQNMKPVACKLWPFRILKRPKYGKATEAALELGDGKMFAYVDPLCKGLKFGNPSEEFLTKILPEFVGISLGSYSDQHYSTIHPGRAYPRFPLLLPRVV